jgi:hypothetical protein
MLATLNTIESPKCTTVVARPAEREIHGVKREGYTLYQRIILYTVIIAV